MMEPERVDAKSEKLYNFNFEEFDDRISEAMEIIYQDNLDECKAYVMLGNKHEETFPMGVILFKMPEPGLETEAFKTHLRKFIEKFDE